MRSVASIGLVPRPSMTQAIVKTDVAIIAYVIDGLGMRLASIAVLSSLWLPGLYQFLATTLYPWLSPSYVLFQGEPNGGFGERLLCLLPVRQSAIPARRIRLLFSIPSFSKCLWVKHGLVGQGPPVAEDHGALAFLTLFNKGSLYLSRL